MIRLSQAHLSSYVGDVLPLELIGEGITKNTPVTFRISGDAATLRSFEGDGTYAFSNGVLVSFAAPGEAIITARYLDNEYTATVIVREIMSVDDSTPLNYYIGDLHDHTSQIHNRDEFAKHLSENIDDYVNFIKDENLIDFGVISDHGCVTNDYDFYRGFCLAGSCDHPIVFAGAESEIGYTERDRLNVVHRHSGEIVTFMSAGYGSVKTWAALEHEMSYSYSPSQSSRIPMW